VTLSECTLSSNSAERGGGAVAVEAGAGMRLERCTLTDNSCGTFGGAVYGGFLPSAAAAAAALATSIQQCTFERNVGRGTGPVRVPRHNPSSPHASPPPTPYSDASHGDTLHLPSGRRGV
jgi:hypothetical protein